MRPMSPGARGSRMRRPNFAPVPDEAPEIEYEDTHYFHPYLSPVGIEDVVETISHHFRNGGSLSSLMFGRWTVGYGDEVKFDDEFRAEIIRALDEATVRMNAERTAGSPLLDRG